MLLAVNHGKRHVDYIYIFILYSKGLLTLALGPDVALDEPLQHVPQASPITLQRQREAPYLERAF